MGREMMLLRLYQCIHNT